MNSEEGVTTSSYETQVLSFPAASEMFDKEHDQDEIEEEDLGTCSSDFGDWQCGEAPRPQHLVIDFAPRGDDDEQVREKVVEFWKFIDAPAQLKAKTAASVMDESGDSCLMVDEAPPVSPPLPPQPPLERPDPTTSPLHTPGPDMLRRSIIGSGLCTSCHACPKENAEEQVEEEYCICNPGK
ncbi:hypothetical protein JYU34_013149 [Plutella xylostella]|uniref:Uncharacterized protein n=1 Tax=Plutella xylostella TaxID=51655 RepID=A0ABQ7QEC0_PLUXY|nr:hypothetical protein JYU34_013149 [Plutella xylostella]